MLAYMEWSGVGACVQVHTVGVCTGGFTVVIKLGILFTPVHVGMPAMPCLISYHSRGDWFSSK